jgi:hypothetical protein
MSRTFWFAAGAASGVYAMVKAKRTAQNFTPDGVAARLASLRAGARVFAADVSTGMAEREAAIREQAARAELAPSSRPPGAPAALESLRPSDHESADHGHG